MLRLCVLLLFLVSLVGYRGNTVTVQSDMTVIPHQGMQVVYWPNRVMVFPDGYYHSLETFEETDENGAVEALIRADGDPDHRLNFGNNALYYTYIDKTRCDHDWINALGLQAFVTGIADGKSASEA